MKTFYLKLTALTLSTLVIISILFNVICIHITGIYDDSYQKGFVYQYRALQNADPNEKKMIVIGGSYMTFAVDSRQLSDSCNMPVYTLGIHSGMGMDYIIETARKFAKEGDVIVFPFFPFEPDEYGMDLIYLSLDSEPDMFWEFFRNHPGEVIKSAGSAVYTKLYGMTNIDEFLIRVKNGENDENGSTYKASSFDPDTGNLILKREGCEFTEIESYSGSLLDIKNVSRDCIKEVNKLSGYCNEKGIDYYMLYGAFPGVFYNNPSQTEISEFEKALEKELNLQFIVDMNKCVVPEDYIYNAIIHLNDAGKDYYTNLIYEGLSKYITFPET